MLYKKLLIIGAAFILMGAKSVNAEATDVSLNNLISHVGVAAVIGEEMDATRYIEFNNAAKLFRSVLGAYFIPKPVLYHPSFNTDGTPDISPPSELPVVKSEI